MLTKSVSVGPFSPNQLMQTPHGNQASYDFHQSFLKFGFWPELPFEKQVALRKEYKQSVSQPRVLSETPNLKCLMGK